MDYFSLAKLRRVLVLLIVFGLLADARPVIAQNGACPPNSLLLGEANGSYPSDLRSCAYDSLVVSMQDTQGNFPCSQYIFSDVANPILINIPTGKAIYVPANTQYLGQEFRFRALFFTVDTFNPLIELAPPGILAHGNLIVRYYDNAGNLFDSRTFDINTFQRVTTYWEGTLINHYYNVYVIDMELISNYGFGGYLTIHLDQPEDDFSRPPVSWGLASVQVGAVGDYFPTHCPIPNANLPQPTPTTIPQIPATWTPNPTPGVTSTPTPVTTPGATAPGITPPPLPTITPIIFPTLPPESTPTPWPPYTIPTISFPTRVPALTVIAAGPTVTAVSGGLGDLAGSIEADWASSLLDAEGNMNTTISGTTGVEPPDTMIPKIVAGISVPVSYVKSIEQFMPNAYPYIIYLIMVAGWVLFNRIAKFSLGIVGTIYKLFRTIWDMVWEAIPL